MKNETTIDEVIEQERERKSPKNKRRRFKNNGPAMAMQKKYFEGDISEGEYWKHCNERLKTNAR